MAKLFSAIALITFALSCEASRREIIAASCSPLQRLSAGTGITCAINSGTDTKVCFGQDARTTTCPGIESMHSDIEAAESLPPRFQQISTGASHACAITLWDTIRCWGAGPAAAPVAGQYAYVSASRYVNCAIFKSNWTLNCWGDKQRGDVMLRAAPKEIPFQSVHLGRSFGCGVRLNDSHPQCWPVADSGIVPNIKVLMVKTGADFACALDEQHKLYCWASDGSTTHPVVVAAQEFHTYGFLQIAVGRDFGCGVDVDGFVDCFADPAHKIFQDQPQTDENFIGVVAGSEHACAIHDNYTVFCWPKNEPYGATKPPANLTLCPAGYFDPTADDIIFIYGYSTGQIVVAIVFSLIAGILLDRVLISNFVRERCGLKKLFQTTPAPISHRMKNFPPQHGGENEIDEEEDEDDTARMT